MCEADMLLPGHQSMNYEPRTDAGFLMLFENLLLKLRITAFCNLLKKFLFDLRPYFFIGKTIITIASTTNTMKCAKIDRSLLWIDFMFTKIAKIFCHKRFHDTKATR